MEDENEQKDSTPPVLNDEVSVVDYQDQLQQYLLTSLRKIAIIPKLLNILRRILSNFELVLCNLTR